MTRRPASRWRAEPLAFPAVACLIADRLYHDREARTLWIASQGALVSLDLAWREARPRPLPAAHVRRVETSGRELIFGGTPVSASASSARTRLRRRFHRHGGRTTRGVLRLRIASSLATPDSPVAADVSRLAHPATNHLLQIEVANTGIWEFATVPSDSTGLGLENLRRRLRRYYPDAHEFSIGQEGGWVVAKLAISNCQLPIEQPRTSA